MKRAFLITTCILGVFAVFLLAAMFYYIGVTSGEKLDTQKLKLDQTAVRVYDAAGEEIEGAEEKETVAFSALPSYLPNAFVAVEDKRFYDHHGFDYRRIGKAILKNVASFSFREGASTISQQLIKNTHLSGEKTIKRKLKELKLTRALEKRYSKEEILELYLNSIYFGHNAFGVERAARFYFGKDASALSPAESATLAALVKSPNRYSPFRNAEKCLSRRNFVLSLMKEQNYIGKEEYEEALSTPLPQEPHERKREAGSYLYAVYEELYELFPDAKTGELASLKVYTALDRELQKKLEEIKADSDVCALVRDNKTDLIKALYATAGTPKRLPASTVKPLLVYAPALEENLISPATPVLDEKVDFAGYSPSNYNGTYGGYMSARYALAHSVNVPAVKILNELGTERACKYLSRMNMEVDKDDYSLALALGGMKEGFTLPALADAYATFARGGSFSPSRTVLRVEDANGRTIYEYKPQTRSVFSSDVCFLIIDMLQTAVKEGTAKKLRSLPFPVCAKTGTGANAEGNTDAYTIAYTHDDTVAVWMGNRDNSPIDATGGGLPANAALRIMQSLYRNGAPAPFPSDANVEKISFDKEEYDRNHQILRADPLCPPIAALEDYFRKCALPQGESARFTRPTIPNPAISVTKGSVCIELCQTQYYDYVIKRKNNGEEITVYSGKYREKIYDNSVKNGQVYTYTVIPVYRGTQGDPVVLPSVKVQFEETLPDDWWE